RAGDRGVPGAQARGSVGRAEGAAGQPRGLLAPLAQEGPGGDRRLRDERGGFPRILERPRQPRRGLRRRRPARASHRELREIRTAESRQRGRRRTAQEAAVRELTPPGSRREPREKDPEGDGADGREHDRNDEPRMKAWNAGNPESGRSAEGPDPQEV